MRLGEILVAEGLVLEGDVERELKAQRHATARIGSLLVSCGLVTADAVARALSRQLGVPAALEKHLIGRDKTLADRIAPALARQHMALPIARSRDGAVVVCLRDPTSPDAIADLEKTLGVRIVPAVCAEAVLAPLVEQVYGHDDVDINIEDDPPVADEPNDEATTLELAKRTLDDVWGSGLTLANLDDAGVSRDLTQNSMQPTAARVPTPSFGPSSKPAPVSETTPGPNLVTALASASRAASQVAAAATQASADVANQTEARRVSASIDAVADAQRVTKAVLPMLKKPPPGPASAPIPLALTIAQLATATTRDLVAELAINFLRDRVAAAIVLVVRDGAAIGHRGFGTKLTASVVEAAVLPLQQASTFRTVIETRTPFAGDIPDQNPLEERFLKMFDGRDLIIVPVTLGTRVVCAIACRAALDGKPLLPSLVQLGAAMANAFTRIIVDSKVGAQ